MQSIASRTYGTPRATSAKPVTLTIDGRDSPSRRAPR